MTVGWKHGLLLFMETTALATLTTIDQFTLRPIHWNVESVSEMTMYGWTHQYLVTRPKGRSTYVIDVTLVGDVVVKHSSARKLW